MTAIIANGPGIAISVGGTGFIGNVAGFHADRRRDAAQNIGDMPVEAGTNKKPLKGGERGLLEGRGHH